MSPDQKSRLVEDLQDLESVSRLFTSLTYLLIRCFAALSFSVNTLSIVIVQFWNSCRNVLYLD